MTINRLLAPAYEFAGAQDAARRSLRDLTSGLPDLTIAQVIAALPLTRTHLARRAEGLESLGMPVR